MAHGHGSALAPFCSHHSQPTHHLPLTLTTYCLFLKAVGGAAVALGAMVWYTHANLSEQQLSAGASAAAALTALATPGSSPSSSTASLEEGEVLLQSRHKRSGQGAGS